MATTMTMRHDGVKTVSRLSFRKWLRAVKATDDAAGDLILDLQSDDRAGWDGDCPRFATERALRAFLLSRGACDGALSAAPKVWARYLAAGMR